MRVKQSVTLPAKASSHLKRKLRDERDAKIINAKAVGLNTEAEDVLEYQGPALSSIRVHRRSSAVTKT